MTFSIVARDPSTGALGAAVQTCMFAAGKDVLWCRPGVGAVATQAFGEPAYGVRCLDRMRNGATAPEALAEAGEQAPALLLGARRKLLRSKSGVHGIVGRAVVDMNQGHFATQRARELAADLGRAHRDRLLVNGDENSAHAHGDSPLSEASAY